MTVSMTEWRKGRSIWIKNYEIEFHAAAVRVEERKLAEGGRMCGRDLNAERNRAI